MKRFLIIRAAIVATLFLVSCSNKTNSAQVSASLTMTGSGQSATVAKNTWPAKIYDFIFPSAYAFVPTTIVDSNGTTVILNDAWILVKNIEFEADEVPGAGETDGNEVEFQGPYAIDLLSTAPVVLDTQLITQAAYRRIKMKLHKAESAVAGAPVQLLNNSIYFSGSVGANAFTYESDDTTEFEIGGPNPVLPTDGANILIQIQLANIFKQIDMSGVPNGAVISASNLYAGVNLCPSIDPSANDIYTCVRNGLRAHADWGKDVDDNDVLDNADEAVK